MTGEGDWGDDGPCPDWCVTGSQHLEFRLSNNDYWHKGRSQSFQTLSEDYNRNPLEVSVHLSQRVQVDERGHYRHPVMVSLGGYELTAEQARTLSAALVDLADMVDPGT